MSYFFEIAYAAVAGKICLFTGTGFSKAISGDNAPNWQKLLETLCDKTTRGPELKQSLFPNNARPTVSLDEAAQIISIQLAMDGTNIYDEAANIVKDVDLAGENGELSRFLKEVSVKVITTNYDKLLERMAGKEEFLSIAPGLPIPRSQSRIEIYHVHGSIDSPNNMVITTDDYFRFINSESYFSRKISTLLHENTVIILGYSLGDTNLKAIFSEYRRFAKSHLIGSNIFFVSRRKVAQEVKDYYSYCYGIRVIDYMEVEGFFGAVNEQLENARKKNDIVASMVHDAAETPDSWADGYDEYLKMESSFYEIITYLSASGKGFGEPAVVGMIGKILEKKAEMVGQLYAWDQYEHLARWLVHLTSILDITSLSIKEKVIHAVGVSMWSMSSKQELGKSWASFGIWQEGWPNVIPENRNEIRLKLRGEMRGNGAALLVLDMLEGGGSVR